MRFRLAPAALTLIAIAGFVATRPLPAQTPERSTGNLEPTLAPTAPTTPTAPKEPAAAKETATAPETAKTPETAKAQTPAKPREPHKVVFGTGEKKRMVEGKTRAGDSAIVLFAAPVDQMFNVRLSSPDNQAILLVYQPGADEPDAGTREQEGAIGWTGVCEKKGDLKLEVRTKSEQDLPFRLEIALPTGEGQP